MIARKGGIVKRIPPNVSCWEANDQFGLPRLTFGALRLTPNAPLALYGLDRFVPGFSSAWTTNRLRQAFFFEFKTHPIRPDIRQIT